MSRDDEGMPIYDGVTQPRQARALEWQFAGNCLVALLCLSAMNGCLRQYVLNSTADALSATSGPQGGAFATDNDPELVGEAMPFGLKVMEALLQEIPEHRGLRVALAAGFTQYAQGFVLPRKDRADFREASEIEQRVKKLHLRGHSYGVGALELTHPGFAARFSTEPEMAVASLQQPDMDALFWTAASLGAAVSFAGQDMDLLARLPQLDALIDRAISIDVNWNEGALHELLISYEGRSKTLGGSAERAEHHFERAVALQKGGKAAPYVALAEAVAVKSQDRERFKRLLRQALAVDPDAVPHHRLANLVAQQRARHLLTNIEELFL